MIQRALGILCVVVVVIILLPIAALSQSVTLQINNPPSNNVLDGIYVGSYTATNVATGGTVQITCDDFRDDSDSKVTTYTTNTFSSLGSTLWGASLSAKTATTLYDEAAWLTLTMLNQTGKQQGYYSYAIWAVFASGDVAKWLTSYQDSAACNAVFGAGSWVGGTAGKGTCNVGTGGLIGLAASQTFTSGEFANVLILTPTCSGGPGTCPEQEFLEVVPEGGSAAVYLLLAGLVSLGAVFFGSRRTVRRPV